ncbi:hypothetical protein BDF14DRAFT_1881025 [Spinellus fusiger]|nr:hypothetical protein BDF14DRAFT_1881025 [Spinellus fusiger]
MPLPITTTQEIQCKDEIILHAPKQRTTPLPPLHHLVTFGCSTPSQYSATSTSTSTYSQRYSVTSSIGSVDQGQRRWSVESGTFDSVPQLSPTNTSFSSFSPSRLLLSGATNSENFRLQELSRFYPTSCPLKEESDSQAVASGGSCDTIPSPWSIDVKTASEQALCSDWLQRHAPSLFTFVRSWKRRYTVLLHHTVYVFKSNKPTALAQDHFVLTEDTFVFVSEEFKKGYVLELRKPLCKWFLRCESVAEMKCWLEAMKKVVAFIKLGYQGIVTVPLLNHFQLADDHRLLVAKTASQDMSEHLQQHRSPSVRTSLINFQENPLDSHGSPKRLSLKDCHYRRSVPLSLMALPSPTLPSVRQSVSPPTPRWEGALPPQLPPPQSIPPPVPQSSPVAEV